MNYWELFITYRWPHEGFILGYEFIEADEDYSYATIKLHLGFISFELDFG